MHRNSNNEIKKKISLQINGNENGTRKINNISIPNIAQAKKIIIGNFQIKVIFFIFCLSLPNQIFQIK
jgi:hypothetical protein